MAKNKKIKSPFINGTPEQVEQAEKSSYYIQAGDDIFTYNSQPTFNKKEAEAHYQNRVLFLREVIEFGNATERKLAVSELLSLKIHPLRIQ
jgi:hypothetical protein